MTRTITDIYSTARVTQRDLDNWFARLSFNTHFAPTTSGRQRIYSKENVLELAFVKGAVKAGLRASQAVVFADAFLRSYRTGSGMAARRWLAFPIGNFDHATASDDLTGAFIERACGDEDGVVLIDIGSIIARVEAAFSDEAA